ncbi:MAG: hypothetical protein ACLPVY_12225 [Acidimicrobiia bacterium]
MYRVDLHDLIDTLPDDRREPLKRAEAEVRHNEDDLRRAKQELARAHAAHDDSQQRHWGRRDKATIARAETDIRAATRNRDVLAEKVAQSKTLAERERHNVRYWAAATRNTADRRDNLTKAIKDLDIALAVTRPERVIAAAIDPANELWRSIGPPPATRGGLAAWCGIAEQVETERDRGRPNLGTRRVNDDLGAVLGHAHEIIDAASRQDPTPTHRTPVDPSLWQPRLAGSRRITEPTQQTLEQGVGLEL